MTLTLHDYTNALTETNHSNMIFDAIREGMAPFRWKRIDLYAEYDIDYHEYRILAGVVLMSGYTISFTERVGAWDLTDYPDREYKRVADAMLKAFRYREDFYDLAPLIQLGRD